MFHFESVETYGNTMESKIDALTRMIDKIHESKKEQLVGISTS